MKISNPSAFISQALAFSLLGIGLSGTVGVSAVWMRERISTEANTIKALQARLADVNRHLDETAAAIATEQDETALLRRNALWNLGLAEPAQERMVRVTTDPVEALVAKRDRGRFNDSRKTPSVSLALQH